MSFFFLKKKKKIKYKEAKQNKNSKTSNFWGLNLDKRDVCFCPSTLQKILVKHLCLSPTVKGDITIRKDATALR